MATKCFLLALIACTVINESWAAKRVDAHVVARDTMRRRRSREELIQRRDETPLDTNELLQLTPGESLEDVAEAKDVQGSTFVRFVERYKSLKVYDTVVTVRKDSTGQLTGDATGHLIQGIDEDLPDVEASLSDDELLNIALENEGDDYADITSFRIEEEIYIDKKSVARLVGIVSYLIDGVKRPMYIIDAKNGEILEHWQGLNTFPCCTRNYKAWGGNEKLGRITYGDMPHCLSPTITDGICYLENEYVRVVDMQHMFLDNVTETASFECEKGYGDEVNGAYSPAIDAFFYGTVVGKMFEEWFQSKPLKEKVVLRVHYGSLYENAFWNGENTTFGDGGYMMYPLTSLDVVAHEVGHGVTEQGSGLEYRHDSGGVNEAFSDIMGEAAEDYLLESDFMTGRTIMKSLPYLREFETPENDNRSISQVGDMTEHEDPHYSSGVFRRVWWVVTKEGGVPIRDAAHVFLHANRMYWHSTATFHDCACGTLKAALDLGHDTAPFRNAFKDVGLEDCDLATHIFGLNNNQTQQGIVVSETINPLFKMETPDWADKLIVDVRSSSRKRDIGLSDAAIMITVTKNGWEITDDECESAEFVAEGVGHVELPDAGEDEYFFKLSLPSTNDTMEMPMFYSSNSSWPDSNSNTTTTTTTTSLFSYLVDLTVGYTCLQNYSSDYMSNYFYERDCGKSL